MIADLQGILNGLKDIAEHKKKYLCHEQDLDLNQVLVQVVGT
jgi:hypothetical protein